MDSTIGHMNTLAVQMRVMSSKAASQPTASETLTETSTSFSNTLKNSLQQVNELQVAAKTMAEDYEKGADVPITEVVLAMQRSSMAFETTLQVRNKVMSAYQDIMSMPV